MKKTDPPIIVEVNYSASVEKVWEAMTQSEKMIQWFFENIESFQAEVGFETSFAIQSNERTFTHVWKIKEVIPSKKISYSWSYEEYSGDGFVEFEIFEKENGTQLRLTNIITEDYPNDIPEFKRESCIGGWNYFLGERLKAFLEKE
jgi:uncharacterized protein YndB with AHSA1/START domain